MSHKHVTRLCDAIDLESPQFYGLPLFSVHYWFIDRKDGNDFRIYNLTVRVTKVEFAM